MGTTVFITLEVACIQGSVVLQVVLFSFQGSLLEFVSPGHNCLSIHEVSL